MISKGHPGPATGMPVVYPPGQGQTLGPNPGAGEWLFYQNPGDPAGATIQNPGQATFPSTFNPLYYGQTGAWTGPTGPTDTVKPDAPVVTPTPDTPAGPDTATLLSQRFPFLFGPGGAATFNGPGHQAALGTLGDKAMGDYAFDDHADSRRQAALQKLERWNAERMAKEREQMTGGGR